MTRRVQPFESPVDADVDLPASKSQLIRSLAAAALANGRSHLYGPSLFEDSEAMLRVVTSLGAVVVRGDDVWSIDGLDGRVALDDSVLDCGESGLSARLGLAMAASGDGRAVVTGSGRLPERPMSGLVKALRSQGAEIDRESLPVEVVGRGPLWGKSATVDVSETTQFATALLVVAPIMRNPLELEITGLWGSSGYLDMTRRTLAQFGVETEQTMTGVNVREGRYRSADVLLDRDASAAVYPAVAAAMTRGRVRLKGLGASNTHPDMRVLNLLTNCGIRIEDADGGLVFDASDAQIEGFDVDLSESPDGAIALAVLALTATGDSRLAGLGSLRFKESDRLNVVADLARQFGAEVEVTDNSLSIRPQPLHPATIDPRGDHRIAMSFALLAGAGLTLEISDPDVVNKTWPGYWQFLDNLSEK